MESRSSYSKTDVFIVLNTYDNLLDHLTPSFLLTAQIRVYIWSKPDSHAHIVKITEKRCTTLASPKQTKKRTQMVLSNSDKSVNDERHYKRF